MARVTLVGAVLLLMLVISTIGYYLSLPGVGDAETRVLKVLAAHGGLVDTQPVPTKLGEALVAVEDEHFYSNVALDVIDGAARAALASVHSSGDPGGSTIAQQLAKQLYGDGSGFGATLRQIGLGVKLELHYSKTQILEMYLDVVYYGNGDWGYRTAALGYFGTSPNHLTWAEASLLAGLPEAPSAYDPLVHLSLAKQRQRHVLDQLVVNDFLTAAQAARAYGAPLHLRQ